ncbi:MAG: hypothetical protein ACKVHE_01945 [Planctomycetales bacterium]|jgi:hypothetical protein
MRNRLRIFPTDESVESVQSNSQANVTLKLGEILEPLAEALQSQRAFIEDFADDEVRIPTDLYEALLATVSMRKSA